MERFRYTHQLPVFQSKLMDRYFGGLRMGVFDIETMGLNPVTAELILAGFLSVEPDGRCQVTQYFAETKAEETNILRSIEEELQTFDYVLTYNGKHFDLPFTAKRAALKGLEPFRPGCYNLDLYLVLHGHSNLKSVLQNLRQKTVEDYMGLHPDRRDQISGAEGIQLYEDYLAEEDVRRKERLKEKILLHNHDDLVQLYRILPVILKTDLHRAMSYLGFPVAGRDGWPQLNVSRVRIDYAGLTITGSYGGPAFSYISYDDGTCPWSCHFTREGEFQFLVPTRRHQNSHFLNLKQTLPQAVAPLSRYPGYVNGFLILSDSGKTNFLEANMLTQIILQTFMEETAFPRQAE